jgi:hypothetical protein
MPENPLIKKLKLKSGMQAALIHAPDGYLEEISPLPEGVAVHQDLEGGFDWIQVFVRDQAELKSLYPGILSALKPAGMLWISFPKGTSRIQTDLTRDQGWDILKGSNLKWLTLVSVDATWSAFSLRPYRPGEEHQSFR